MLLISNISDQNRDGTSPAVGNLAHNYGAQAQFLATESVAADGSPTENPKNFANKAAFSNPPYKYGVIERTFSEYKAGLISQTPVDDYVNLPADLQGSALKARYDAATDFGTKSANYEDGDTRFYSCQGCNKNPPFRNNLPRHDMTGGNYWMPEAIKYLDGQNKLRLGGGLNSIQLAALDAGALRTREQLSLAATLAVDNTAQTVKIVNHTVHKLISGYPEGRRMWLRTTWTDAAGQTLRIDGDQTPGCESAFSNIVCAIPNNPGQNNLEATLSTGRYETTGKGKNQTTTFVATTLFNTGVDAAGYAWDGVATTAGFTLQ